MRGRQYALGTGRDPRGPQEGADSIHTGAAPNLLRRCRGCAPIRSRGRCGHLQDSHEEERVRHFPGGAQRLRAGKKGWLVATQLALYTIEQVLQEALAAESTSDTDVHALMELLLQQRRPLVETQAQIPRSVEGCVQQTTSSIRRDGREVADLIHGGCDPKEIDRRLQEAQARVQTRTDDLANLVQDSVERHMASLAERVQQIAESELARELLPRLVARIEIELGRSRHRTGGYREGPEGLRRYTPAWPIPCQELVQSCGEDVYRIGSS